MQREVVPAILAKSEREFREKLHTIERVTPLVQIDVMDGVFVPNTTWADPLVVAQIKTPTRFEVHLMVKEPFREVILWGKLPHVRRTIVHAESTAQLRALLHTVRATGKEVGLAVNPGTPLKEVYPFLFPHPLKLPLPGGGEKKYFPPSHREGGRGRVGQPSVDFILVMSNDPGFSGRPFRRATLKRIATLRKQFPRLPIGVDIGVSESTAPLLRKAGATYIAAASSVFESANPIAAYYTLQHAFGVNKKMRAKKH